MGTSADGLEIMSFWTRLVSNYQAHAGSPGNGRAGGLIKIKKQRINITSTNASVPYGMVADWKLINT